MHVDTVTGTSVIDYRCYLINHVTSCCLDDHFNNLKIKTVFLWSCDIRMSLVGQVWETI